MKDQATFTTDVFAPSTTSWKEIRERIILLEREAFEERAFSDEDMSADFSDEKNSIVLLKQDGSNKIIGFTYAKPESPETAFMWDTVIDKDFRGKNLVGMLMACLEQELKRKGYIYLEREAAVAHNYARNIAKAYKGRIMEQSAPHDSVYGQQVFFRIRL